MLHVERSRFHKKSRQDSIMLQVTEPNMFTCSMPDILKFMVSVIPTGITSP